MAPASDGGKPSGCSDELVLEVITYQNNIWKADEQFIFIFIAILLSVCAGLYLNVILRV